MKIVKELRELNINTLSNIKAEVDELWGDISNLNENRWIRNKKLQRTNTVKWKTQLFSASSAKKASNQIWFFYLKAKLTEIEWGFCRKTNSWNWRWLSNYIYISSAPCRTRDRTKAGCKLHFGLYDSVLGSLKQNNENIPRKKSK